MSHILNQSNRPMSLINTKGFIIVSLIAGAIAAPFLIPIQKAQADSDDSGPGGYSDALLGTWVTQVSINPASVPPGSVLNFTVVPTYGAGGGFVLGGKGNGPGGTGGGPDAHGNWVATSGRHYAATSSGSGFDDAHHYTLETKIRENLTLNKRGDQLTGSFQVDLILPDGTVLPFHPAGTYLGHRMPVEPLN
jgi:hypothetical protein